MRVVVEPDQRRAWGWVRTPVMPVGGEGGEPGGGQAGSRAVGSRVEG